jgi:hypothetical protein
MMELNPHVVLPVVAWVVALLFGKHLQAGYSQWSSVRLAEQPIRPER